MTLPADHAARNAYILQAATQQQLAIDWSPLQVADRLTVLVTARPVKLDDVYFGAGALLAQQVADAVGALLVTPKLVDLMYLAREVDLAPIPLYGRQRPDGVLVDSTTMMDTATFEYNTALLDAAIGGRAGIAQTVGKPFVASNLATPTRGVNYGWSLPKGTLSPWHGVPIYPSVTLSSMVIQQPGSAHDLAQDDYASVCLLAHRDCTLDGAPYDLAKVYQDPTLAALVSHEGPLKNVRQPGVPIFSCALSGAVATSPDLCPLPPAPTPAPKPSKPAAGGGAGIIIAAGAALATATAGWWWLTRRRARPSRV